MGQRNKNKDGRKLVQAFLPSDLYKRFQASEWRQQFMSDGEAVRAMIRATLATQDQGRDVTATT